MAKSVKSALEGKKVELCESKRSTYADSDTPICYLLLSEEFHGQDTLVLSRSAAEDMQQAQDQWAYLAECEVTLGETADGDEVYGITRKAAHNVVSSHTF